MELVVAKTGEFSHPNAGAFDPANIGKVERANGAGGISEFVTPFTPLTCDFGEISKARWFSMVRMYAMDAVVLYLQMTSKFPSWTSRVRSPSPALYFQRASAILTPFPAAKRSNGQSEPT